MWFKQKSPDAVIFVDGSRERMPWHIATFVWMFLCLLLRLYCVRLKTLSKHEEVKAMILEKEIAARGKVSLANKVSDKVIMIKDMIVLAVLAVLQKAIVCVFGEKSESASRQSEDNVAGFWRGRLDREKYKNIDVFKHSESDSEHSLEASKHVLVRCVQQRECHSETAYVLGNMDCFLVLHI